MTVGGPDSPIPDSAAQEPPRLRASQRIAVGTFARSVGEVVAKLASLVLYVAIARELGEGRFGDFVFAVSLSTVLLIGAGLGLQDLLTREVAKDGRRVNDLFWNVFAVKTVTIVPLLVIVAIVAAAKGYSLDTGAAAVVIAISMGLEFQSSTYYAVFQGFEKNHHVATCLIVNRISTAIMGIGVLAAGAGLLVVAAVVALGSGFGIGTAHLLMRRVARPSLQVEPRRWPELIRVGLPLGLIPILHQSLFRVNVVMLGFLASSGVVGEYGAASRLTEAMMFVPWAFGGAIMPWFSRHTGEGAAVPIARGYEMAMKTMLALMLPVALVFGLFAEQLTDFLYGAEYAGAILPLQLLAVMTVLYALNALATTVLIGRNVPQGFTRPAALILLLNVALSAILIPPYGADGAAVALVASSAVLLVFTYRNLIRLIGMFSPVKVLFAPLASGATLTVVAVLLSGLGWAPAAAVSLAVYGLLFLFLERTLFPNDFAFYAGALRVRRARAAS